MANSPTTVLTTVPLFRLFLLLLLLLITLQKECCAELIDLEELDNQIGPYAIEWPLASETAKGGDEGRENAGGENWVPELLRLRKRWSTQLRLGKRTFAGPRKQWASQVRFGRK